MGLAVLSRMSSLFAVPIFFSRKLSQCAVWVVCLAAVTAAWFLTIYHYHGVLFYFPDIGSARNNIGWLSSISRPWHTYISDLLYLSPIFILAVPGMLSNLRKEVPLIAWIVSFLTMFSVLVYTSKPLGVEDRYLLGCYPALAILAAQGIESLQKFLPKRFLFLAVFIACIWSLQVSCPLILSRESLIFVLWAYQRGQVSS